MIDVARLLGDSPFMEGDLVYFIFRTSKYIGEVVYAHDQGVEVIPHIDLTNAQVLRLYPPVGLNISLHEVELYD